MKTIIGKLYLPCFLKITDIDFKINNEDQPAIDEILSMIDSLLTTSPKSGYYRHFRFSVSVSVFPFFPGNFMEKNAVAASIRTKAIPA